MSREKNPLILVEVIPIIDPSDDDECSVHPFISAPMAKTQLIDMSRRCMLHPGWMDCDEGIHKLPRGARDIDINDIKKARGSSMCIFLRVHRKQETSDTETIFPTSVNKGDIVSGTIYYSTEGSDVPKSMHSNYILVTYLQSDDPLCEFGVPCLLQGHIFQNSHEDGPACSASIQQDIMCEIVVGTSVQILPPINARCFGWERSNYICNDFGGQNKIYSKLKCYDDKIVQSLTLRMSMMLRNTSWIGTTPRALSFWKRHLMTSEMKQQQLEDFYLLQRKQCIEECLRNESSISTENVGTKQSTIGSDPIPYLLKEGALLLYNSHPNSGKTTLVTAIAKEVLKCDAVHVISAPAIFAKYGTSSDAALETILHELVLRRAVKSVGLDPTASTSKESPENGCVGKICIVLDHFETFIDHGSNIDSYSPVLNSMASHLNRLAFSLKNNNEYPFPSSSTWCNNIASDASPAAGFVLPVGVCLIGVMTCTDDERNNKQIGSQLSRALDSIGGGRMCLPLPSASTRLSALYHSFDALGIKLDDEATQTLHELAVSISWAFGRSFFDVAKQLNLLMGASSRLANRTDLRRAVELVENKYIKTSRGAKSSFSSTITASGSCTDVFASVGGNKEAKLALEDALALNPKKRRLLSLFGLQAPTGVLLYGPPGTGKTILARAVAHAISTKDSCRLTNVGGTFISLKASDIVRPEVGDSEKLIVSAFESARVNAPSVIFIDEFQALFGDRDGSGVVVGQLASTLLQCMDDITRWSDQTDPSKDDIVQNGRVVVLGATNTPWMIDKAFLRPGRFDRTVHVGLPTLVEREEILRVHSCKMKLASAETRENICKSMAQLCLGFSGADLAALCRAAAVRCLSEGDEIQGIDEKHYKGAFMNDVVPSSNHDLVERITNWKA